MLKKLIKFGNSHAIVLNKPFMAMLGLQEGDFVRISSDDGKSLKITPVPAQETQQLSANDRFQIAAQTIGENRTAKGVSDALQDYEALSMSSPQFAAEYKAKMDAMQAIYAELFKKYHDAMQLIKKMVQNPEYQKKLAAITVQFDPVERRDEYFKAVIALRYVYCPEIKAFDDEVNERITPISKEIEELAKKTGIKK